VVLSKRKGKERKEKKRKEKKRKGKRREEKRTEENKVLMSVGLSTLLKENTWASDKETLNLEQNMPWFDEVYF
jgi:hypothetical protein